MLRLAPVIAGIVLASCRERSATITSVSVTDGVGEAQVGELVLVDAFAFNTCDLEALAFFDGTHGYVRDACRSIFGTVDGGESFVAVDELNRGWRGFAPYPLFPHDPTLSWQPYPSKVPVGISGSLSIDGGRRWLLLDDGHGRATRIALRRKGEKRERIRGTATSAFGPVAWTPHAVLGADGAGPLVARGRVLDGEIADVVRPFPREWLVRTTDGRILRSSKRGWMKEGEDPHALVAADDFDRWLYASAGRGDTSPLDHVLRGDATIVISIPRKSCSDEHHAVTHTIRRTGGVATVSSNSDPPRTLSAAAADALAGTLRSAWRETAVPQRWAFGTQAVLVEVQTGGVARMTGRYAFPSPFAEALLSAVE